MTEAYENTLGLCWTPNGHKGKTCCETQPFSVASGQKLNTAITGASLGQLVSKQFCKLQKLLLIFLLPVLTNRITRFKMAL